MSKTKVYLFHELSSIFPLMEGEDFDALVEDMREKGQLKKGILFEGKILDGRNRYRVCGILKIPFKTEEYSEKISPRDYIISENLHRRHLTVAQRAEIGLILLEEEEKRAKERFSKIKEEEAKVRAIEGKKGFQKINDKEKKDSLTQKIDEISKGKSRDIVAPKVKISPVTLTRAKKIKKVAEKDKSIAKKWEDAKRGKSTVGAVYKEVQKKEAIEDLKDKSPTIVKELKEEKPIITIKEAKAIAEIPSEELIKKEIAERKLVKKRQEQAVQKKKDLAEGKVLPKPKHFDKDANKIEMVKNTCKKAMNDLTIAGLEGYGDFAKKECIKMMKILFEHLRKELKKAGEVAPEKVIEVDGN